MSSHPPHPHPVPPRRPPTTAFPWPVPDARSPIVRLLALAALLLPGLPGGAAPPTPPSPVPPPAVPIAALRQLSLDEAREGRTVSITGVVTYYEPGWNTLFVQDDTAGTYVFAGRQPRPPVEPGQHVQITGRTEAAAPANALREDRIVVLGTAPLPTPPLVDATSFASGIHDAQWIEIDAIVRGWSVRFERLIVELSSGGLHFEAHIPFPSGTPAPASDFVHSRVRVPGVAGSIFDGKGAITGVRLYTPRLENCRTLLPAPADPFAHQLRPLASLAEGTLEIGSRQQVSGHVTFAVPGEAVVADGSAAVLLRFSGPTEIEQPAALTDPRPPPPQLTTGDLIQAVGYFEPTNGLPVLADALVYLTGQRRQIQPASVSAASLAAGDHPLHWVEIEAEFVQELTPEFAGGRRRRWLLEQAGTRFEASLPATNSATIRFDPGSIVRLTGLCEPRPTTNVTSPGFRLRLRSPAEAELLRSPPGWFNRGTVRVAGIGAAIAVALLGWALLLWRESGRQRELNRELGERITERTAALTAANERLEREITQQRRAERIRHALFQISEAVHATDDLQSLYRRIHDTIRQLTGADNLYIASYDPEHNLLSFPYYVDAIDTTPPTRPLGQGFTEYVLRTGQPLLADRATAADLEQRGEFNPVGSPAALWLGVPLILRGQPFGVLAIQEYRDPNAFGEEEKAVLGFVAGQIAIAIDRRRAMDELRASEARLRESEERFSKGFHNSAGSLSIISLETRRYLDVNEGFTRTYGYSRDEVLNRTSLEIGLWPEPADRERLEHLLHTHGAFRNEEVNLRRRDGRAITVTLSADVIVIGGSPCVVVSALDITDRIRVQKELTHALDRERELSRLKTSFVSLVSHEFRTPLGVILSSAEILERYHDRLPPEERAQQVRSIGTSVHRMAHMMNEVLLLGRFDAGRVAFTPATLDLPAFCHRVADEVAAAATHRCPIEVTLDPGLGLGRVSADESLLGHVFTNLLSNAVKYSPEASPVQFRISRTDAHVVFVVADRGCGIPEADHPNLFSAFHRGRNVGQVPGTGLGLVIVQRCIDLHGGSIRFVSPPGQGTTFTVELPLPLAPEPPPPA